MVGQNNQPPSQYDRPFYWSQPWLDPRYAEEWRRMYGWWYPGYQPGWHQPWFQTQELIEVVIRLSTGESFTVGPFPRHELRMVLRVVDYAFKQPFTYDWKPSNQPFTPSVYGVGAVGPFWMTLLAVVLGSAGGALLYDVARNLWEDFQAERNTSGVRGMLPAPSPRVRPNYLPRKGK